MCIFFIITQTKYLSSLTIHHFQEHQLEKFRYHLYLLTSSQPIIEAGLKAQKRFNDILFQGISEDELKCWENILRQMSYNIIDGKEEI